MLQKILTPLYVKKKNSITRGLGKVKSLPKPNPPYRPPLLPPPSSLLPPPSSLLPPPQKSYGRPLIVRASRIVKVLLLLYYLEVDF